MPVGFEVEQKDGGDTAVMDMGRGSNVGTAVIQLGHSEYEHHGI